MGAIAVEEVPRERVHLYGIVDAVPAKEKQDRWGERLLRIKDLVEKPKPEKAPSNLGVTGRYVLPPEIFDYLEKTKPGAGRRNSADGWIADAGEKKAARAIRVRSTTERRMTPATSWDF